jgi:hypothetical protein
VYSLILNLADYSWWLHAFLAIGTWGVLKRKIAREALSFIKQSLADHHLLYSKEFKPTEKKKVSKPEKVPSKTEASKEAVV